MLSKKATIVATDKEHLLVLIQQAIAYDGLECDLNHIDVSRVTNMSGIFSDFEFNGNISTWNVSNVTDMSNTFRGSYFNNALSAWNVFNVTNMHALFRSSNFNNDLSAWNVCNVKNMNFMFDNSKFNDDISAWNVSSVTDMSWMFKDSKFNGDISKWPFLVFAEMVKRLARALYGIQTSCRRFRTRGHSSCSCYTELMAA